MATIVVYVPAPTPPLATVVSVTLTSLTVVSTGTPVTLPSPPTFTPIGGGNWSIAFTEPTQGLVYNFAYSILFSTGQTSTNGGTVVGTAAAAGWYSDQAGIVERFGSYNVAIWSNLDNVNGNNSGVIPVINVAQVQQCINSSDAAINLLAATYNRQTPVPKSIQQWPSLYDLACYDAGIRVYESRGVMSDDSKAFDSKFAAKKCELWGDRMKKIKGAFQIFFTNWQAIQDAPRVATQTNVPQVVLNPVVAPYGTGQGVSMPAGLIPALPNQTIGNGQS